jgi:pSer/pThr/pTyr-binding forkhead associated (FHA) protein
MPVIRKGTPVRTLIPHIRTVGTHDDFTRAKLNELMHQALDMSRETPCCLELFDGTQQRFLFFRERQIYAAGLVRDNQFTDSTIREFLLASGTMNFPQVNWYELNNKILHSLLILFQKKPALRVLTSLVDLDELLDGIETEGKSCIVSASRENFMAMLRYEKGTVTALCHEESVITPREGTFRDEFLVKIYTISAEQPLTINLFEDLLVSYSADAKTIPDTFRGRFEELYLSKPPVVSLQFRGREVDHWIWDKPQFKIGRTPDNDIAIDNLAVSRLHAVLEEEKGNYYVRDCDSLNGTEVNGQKVGRARLSDGDEISIGKHTIVFRRQGGQTVPAEDTIQGFDQTMIISSSAVRTQEAAAANPTPAPAAPRDSKDGGKPRLVMRTEYGDRIIELKNGRLTLGSDGTNDIPIEGLFVARRHAEIVREERRVVLRHLGGLRRVRVDGRAVREIELTEGDEISIAGESFVFQK